MSFYKPLKILISLSIIFFCTHLKAEDLSRVKVGLTLSLTGDGALAGKEMQNAAILANELLAENKFELLFEDDKCSAREATTAAKKFIDFEKVTYASGFYCNTGLIAVSKIYARAGIPIISAGASTGDVTDVGKNIYRLSPADQQSLSALYPYIAKRFKKVAILAEEDAFSQLLKKHFSLINDSSSNPIKIIEEDFLFGETDFRSLITKIKKHEIDAIFVDTATEATLIRLVQQLRELGMNQTVFGV